MNNSNFDNGIPELTEVIAAETIVPPAPPAADVAEPAGSVATKPPPPGTIPQAHALSDYTNAEWQRLEGEIRERIARQVLQHVDTVLEQRVRDSLADVLQTTVEGLTSEIKRGLQHTLEGMIAETVTQEITRLRNSIY